MSLFKCGKLFANIIIILKNEKTCLNKLWTQKSYEHLSMCTFIICHIKTDSIPHPLSSSLFILSPLRHFFLFSQCNGKKNDDEEKDDDIGEVVHPCMMINAIIDINRHTSQEKDEREKHCFFHNIKVKYVCKLLWSNYYIIKCTLKYSNFTILVICKWNTY